MTFINYAAREINCKIVYYGPGLCGKTTNLQYIYDRTNPAAKGKLISLATETDRTLFFDFLPLDLGTVRGFKTRFHLYTVPGQVFYDASRKLILKGVDGVVFVADSQEARMDANVESLQNLEKNLTRARLRPADHPLRPAAQQARPPDGDARRGALPPAELQGRADVRGDRPERPRRLRHAEGRREAGPDGAPEEVAPVDPLALREAGERLDAFVSAEGVGDRADAFVRLVRSARVVWDGRPPSLVPLVDVLSGDPERKAGVPRGRVAGAPRGDGRDGALRRDRHPRGARLSSPSWRTASRAASCPSRATTGTSRAS